MATTQDRTYTEAELRSGEFRGQFPTGTRFRPILPEPKFDAETLYHELLRFLASTHPELVVTENADSQLADACSTLAGAPENAA